MTVGARIRAAREAIGISQMELAERLEVEQGTVSRWENGDREPRLTTLAAIAAALDQDLVYFFENEEEAVA